MLKSLTIKNFILLKEATLNFTNGFNVLCGETGAGKSIIIKALDGVLGAKISKEVILNYCITVIFIFNCFIFGSDCLHICKYVDVLTNVY